MKNRKCIALVLGLQQQNSVGLAHCWREVFSPSHLPENEAITLLVTR